jgi:hypothetical protein
LDSIAAGTGIAAGAITSTQIQDGTLMDVDVNAGAAIAWTKISKAASSLADLVTRSASDLNSGMLAVARLPTGIDAANIGAGSVSNAEFGYLDGVSGPIQPQIDGIVLGQIPNGSITPAKLSFDPATQAELDAHMADYSLQIPYVAAAGAVNVYTATLSPALAAYTAGVALSVNINITNTGASTINVNGLGAKAIIDSKGNAMTSGKLRATGIYTLRYNGTAFQLQGEGGGGTAIAAHILAGETASTDAGDIVGTMVNNGAGGNVTPGTANQTRAAGFWSSVITILGDIALIAANIMVTKTIFGVAGTATADATAGAGDIANGLTAYVNGAKVTGTNTNKAYANGSQTNTSTQLAFTLDSGSSLNYSYLNVTGLNFPNGIAQITLRYNPSGSVVTFYNHNLFTTNSNILMAFGSTYNEIRLTGNAFVNTTSFQLPFQVNSLLVQWEAWGL